ncbi:longitudinals lacking protein, isoforms F/I/K/T-like [Nomia melanderi]|uniref:longitudinals lacking protein, isoforms F/I/K/T-like n=1 Tax=Nomia melanderi TaxID=2448451 RepID=UPI003FCD7ECB
MLEKKARRRTEQLCGRSFRNRRQLTDSEEQNYRTDGLVPVQQANYVCTDCGKEYKWLDSLKRHKRVDCGNKEKKFSCHMCDRKFKYRYELKNHITALHGV